MTDNELQRQLLQSQITALEGRLSLADKMLAEAQEMVGTKWQTELGIHLRLTRELYTSVPRTKESSK